MKLDQLKLGTRLGGGFAGVLLLTLGMAHNVAKSAINDSA